MRESPLNVARSIRDRVPGTVYVTVLNSLNEMIDFSALKHCTLANKLGVKGEGMCVPFPNLSVPVKATDKEILIGKGNGTAVPTSRLERFLWARHWCYLIRKRG